MSFTPDHGLVLPYLLFYLLYFLELNFCHWDHYIFHAKSSFRGFCRLARVQNNTLDAKMLLDRKWLRFSKEFYNYLSTYFTLMPFTMLVSTINFSFRIARCHHLHWFLILFFFLPKIVIIFRKLLMTELERWLCFLYTGKKSSKVFKDRQNLHLPSDVRAEECVYEYYWLSY